MGKGERHVERTHDGPGQEHRPQVTPGAGLLPEMPFNGLPFYPYLEQAYEEKGAGYYLEHIHGEGEKRVADFLAWIEPKEKGEGDEEEIAGYEDCFHDIGSLHQKISPKKIPVMSAITSAMRKLRLFLRMVTLVPK